MMIIKNNMNLADKIALISGSWTFIIGQTILIIIWIILNSTVLKIDEFPFELLTLILSIEAILLSCILLNSQNKTQKAQNLKYDAMIKATEGVDDNLMGIEEQSEDMIDEMKKKNCK